MSINEFNKYTRSPEFKELLANYERSLDSGDIPYYDADDLIDLADYYRAHGDLDKTERTIEHCLTLHPDDSEALLFRARLALLDYHDAEEARSYFDRVQSDAGGLSWVYVKAEIMMVEGDMGEADKFLLEEYDKLRRRCEETEAEPDSDEYADCEDFPLEEARLNMDSNNAQYADEWMKLCREREDDMATEYWETRARIAVAQKRLEEAVEACGKALDLDAYNAGMWLMQCDAQFRMGRFEEALQSAEYAVAVQPSSVDGRLSKANCLYVMNRLSEAEECMKKVLQMVPRDPYSEYLMAEILFDQGETERARAFILDALDDLETLNVAQKVEVLRVAAVVACRQKRYDEAWGYSDRMQEIGESTVEADMVRAMVLLAKEDVEGALVYTVEAKTASGFDTDVTFRLGTIYYEADMPGVACGLFHAAMDRAKYIPDVTYPTEVYAYLAAGYRQLGYKKEYMEYLALAVEHAPFEVAKLLAAHFPPGTAPSEYVEMEKT